MDKNDVISFIGISSSNVWARRDLNSRPPGYQPDALTNLSHGPVWTCSYSFIHPYLRFFLQLAEEHG